MYISALESCQFMRYTTSIDDMLLSMTLFAVYYIFTLRQCNVFLTQYLQKHIGGPVSTVIRVFSMAFISSHVQFLGPTHSIACQLMVKGCARSPG